MIVAETYAQLLVNWPHWAFEMTVEFVTGVLLTPVLRVLVRSHDRRKHKVDA